METYEIHPLADLIPKMTDDEFAKLQEDIREHGLIEPIVLYENKVLDGRHRYQACQQAGVVPRFEPYTGDDPVSFVVAKNLHRRHLNASQRAMLAVDLLPYFEEQAKKRQVATLKQNVTTVPEFFPERSIRVEHTTHPTTEQASSIPLQNSVATIANAVTDSMDRLAPEEPKPLQPLMPKTGKGKDESRAQVAQLTSANPHYVSDAKKITAQAPDVAAAVKQGTLDIPSAKQMAKLSESERAMVLGKIQTEGKKPQTALREHRQDVLQHDLAGQLQQSSVGTPQIVVADALEWLAQQPMADLILTDPPYSTDVSDIAAFAKAWLPLALGRMKPTGRAYIFVGSYPQELGAYLSVAMPDQILVWTYRNTLGPSPKQRYKKAWQAVLYYCGSEAASLTCPELNESNDVQDVAAPDGRQGDRLHPWQKPMVLAERFIRHATRPGDLILDPFAGTGTFLVAAGKLGRRAQGCDQDPEQVALCVKRGCQSDGVYVHP